MDERSLYLQKNQIPELIDVIILRLTEQKPSNPKQFLAAQLMSSADSRFSAREQMPSLNDSHTLVAKTLLPEVYCKARDIFTSLGGTIEQCLAEAFDYGSFGSPVAPGHSIPSGLLVVDMECFEAFREVFEPVIAARYQGLMYSRPSVPLFRFDTNLTKVRGGFSFDERRVRGLVTRIRRNLQGYRFAPAITRAERREVDRMMREMCSSSLQGRYVSSFTQPHVLDGLARVYSNALLLRWGRGDPSPPYRGCYRDWPDARGCFLMSHELTAIHVNASLDHIEVVSAAGEGHNLRDGFDRAMDAIRSLQEATKQMLKKDFCFHPVLGFVTSDPEYMGCGLSVEASLELPHLSSHVQLAELVSSLGVVIDEHMPAIRVLTPEEQDAAKPEAVVIDGGSEESKLIVVRTRSGIGQTNAEICQQMIDAVLKLCDVEEALERSDKIDILTL